MSLFKVFDVIECTLDQGTLVKKFEIEDFNTFSTLIVDESQEALFYHNGNALGLFGPGRYHIKNDILPVIKHVINIPTGGKSSFKCKVFFINKAEIMSINWGVGDLAFNDPIYNTSFTIGAHGSYNITVDDSRKFCIKINAGRDIYTVEELKNDYRALLTSKISTYMLKLLKSSNVSVFDLDLYLDDISDYLNKILTEELSDYGLAVEKLHIEGFRKPENDPNYQRIKDLRSKQGTIKLEREVREEEAVTETNVDIIKARGQAQADIIRAEAERKRLIALGIDYRTERQYDVLEKAAQNEGSGGAIAGAAMGGGIGMGMAMPFHQAFSVMANDAFAPLSGAPYGESPKTESYGEAGDIPGMISLADDMPLPEFPKEEPQAENKPDKRSKLERVKELDEIKAYLPEEMYNKKLKEILDEI